MSLLQDWRDRAYSQEATAKAEELFWGNYFGIEKGIYEQLLAEPETIVKGTVEELAVKYDTTVMIFVGFLDGINDSLKTSNPIDEMEADTVITLEIDLDKLYYNMVEAKADWLYNLEVWDKLLSPEKRKEIYHSQKVSGTVRKEKKVGRNDPCPCGSGKKYKKCCGANS